MMRGSIYAVPATLRHGFHRSANDLLLTKRTRTEAIEKTAELVAEANRFFVETVKLDSQKMHPEFLDRKSRAEGGLKEAEEACDQFDANGSCLYE